MLWAQEMGEFNFGISYRPGKEGIQPEVLSRREQDMLIYIFLRNLSLTPLAEAVHLQM